MAAFAAEELGAAMGVSTQSAMSLMADALDLRHRLPRLWAEVEDLAVAPWKARRVATDTRSLPLEGARWMDEQLAARVNGFGLPPSNAWSPSPRRGTHPRGRRPRSGRPAVAGTSP